MGEIYTVGTVTELGNGYINLCKYVCIRLKIKKCLFATSSCQVIMPQLEKKVCLNLERTFFNQSWSFYSIEQKS